MHASSYLFFICFNSLDQAPQSLCISVTDAYGFWTLILWKQRKKIISCYFKVHIAGYIFFQIWNMNHMKS